MLNMMNAGASNAEVEVSLQHMVGGEADRNILIEKDETLLKNGQNKEKELMDWKMDCRRS